MEASYVFRVRFRVDPSGATLDPPEFDAVLRLPAPTPGESLERGDLPEDYDWLFFRNALWRGEVGDEHHMRDLATEVLDVDVVDVSFSEFETDQEYLDALREEIAEDLSPFNADDVTEVTHKYFGSSIRVQ